MHKHILHFASAAVLGVALISSVAQAQDPQAGPPAGRRGGQMMDPDQQVQQMRQQLNLTDDQVSQIRPILADAQKQAMALRTDSTVAPEDRRAKMMAIRQDSMAKVKALLTDGQKAQFEQMLAKRQQMMQQRRQEQQSGGNPNQ